MLVFLVTVAAKVPADSDLILLPEGITVVGTGKGYADVVETIPGPTTERLAKLARHRKAYVAALQAHLVWESRLLQAHLVLDETDAIAISLSPLN